MDNAIILDDMDEIALGWSNITTYQSTSHASELIEFVIQRLRGLNGNQLFEALPSVRNSEWIVSSNTSKNEELLVISLFKHRSAIWSEPTRTDFEVRIQTYWNDMGACRLEISFGDTSLTGAVFDALGTLAMKAKLAAA